MEKEEFSKAAVQQFVEEVGSDLLLNSDVLEREREDFTSLEEDYEYHCKYSPDEARQATGEVFKF